jgi:hypothetical protein
VRKQKLVMVQALQFIAMPGLECPLEGAPGDLAAVAEDSKLKPMFSRWQTD